MVLCGITLKFATRTNKSVNVTLHEIGCQGKVSLFMLALLIGFTGNQSGKERGTKTRALVFPLENMTEELNSMAAMENSSEESCRLIFFRSQRDFELKNTSFIKGGDL